MKRSSSDAILECVPNFSEGRRPEVIERLGEVAGSVAGAHLLDRSSDLDHNRTVLTLAGSPEPLVEVLEELMAVAVDRIDLRRQSGVHPRIGAVDVVPFVPLRDAPMAVAVRTALSLAERAARRFELPVFLYGRAARRPERAELSALRQDGLRGVAQRLARVGGEPDFGPAGLHPSAGAVAVGARDFLVAFNAFLDTDDVRVARAIARRVRTASGGLPALKAIGVALESRGCAQVSMNLVDYRVTSPARALEAVEREAARRETRVVGTELVGLIPGEALESSSPAELGIENFHDGLILENALARAGL